MASATCLPPPRWRGSPRHGVRTARLARSISGSHLTTDLTPEPPRLPVRLAVDDDLERSRLTVFFRLLLPIPHFFWLAIWGFFAAAGAHAKWFLLSVIGSTHPGLHPFL